MTTPAVTAEQLARIINEEARAVSRVYLAQGWQPGDHYDLGDHTSDLEQLEDCIGRLATREERMAYEAAIREALSA